MKTELNEIQELTKEKAIGNPVFMFIDPSSTCLGYSLVEMNFVHKKAKFVGAGALWFTKEDNKDHSETYVYVVHSLQNFFFLAYETVLVVVEQYSVPSADKMSGVLVVPELTGAIKYAVKDLDMIYKTILPQSWRKQIGIKPIITKKTIKAKKIGYGDSEKISKDYKTPVLEFVKQHMELPEKVTSNITGRERDLPNDLTDAIGIACGWLNSVGISNWDFSECIINPHIGQVIE